MLTPIQIALLAMLHASYVEHPPPTKNSRDPEDAIAVWGSWQAAAEKLFRQSPSLLQLLGTAEGTREMEWRTLSNRHRRGKPGRRVFLYRLERRTVDLAARCAWAVARLPEGKSHATWRDVPAEVPSGGARCPYCGCTPLKPCTITLAGGKGTACCAPAGSVGSEACSACAA